MNLFFGGCAVLVVVFGIASCGGKAETPETQTAGSGGAATGGSAGAGGTVSTGGAGGIAGAAGAAGTGGLGGAGGPGGAAGAGGAMVDGGSEAATCTTLLADFKSKFAEAIECNPALSSIQCSPGLLVHDECGCQVAANLKTPEKAKTAEEAYNTLVQVGCGPMPCGKPCYVGPNWGCNPLAGQATGECSPAW